MVQLTYFSGKDPSLNRWVAIKKYSHYTWDKLSDDEMIYADSIASHTYW